MTSESRPIESQVGDQLRQSDETLSIAESATGGAICSKVTGVPGASAYFEGGIITYSYKAKLQQLGVSRDDLDTYGAVSKPVAKVMAEGVRDRLQTTWGLSITGVAGPTGGSPDKPVGTMIIGVAYAGEWGTQGSWSSTQEYTLEGDRATIIEASSIQALRDLSEALAN